MSISYPISIPSTPGYRRVAIQPRSAVATYSSPFTYQQQVYAHPGQMWAGEFELPPMSRAEAAPWVAALTSLNGTEGTFYFGDPSWSTPLGSGLGAGYANVAHDSAYNGAELDLRMDFTLTDYTPASESYMVAKYAVGNARFIVTQATSGKFTFYWSTDGTTLNGVANDYFGGVPANLSRQRLRITYKNGETIKFYYGTDFDTWTLYDTEPDPGAILSNSTANLQIATDLTGTYNSVGGFHRVQLRSNVLDDGTGIVYDKTWYPLIKGAAETGYDIDTDGWDQSRTGIMKAGDWVQIGATTAAKLHMVMADVNSDGSGNATLTLWPAVRTAFADNTALTVTSPKGIWRLSGNVPWTVSVDQLISGLTVQFVQAL